MRPQVSARVRDQPRPDSAVLVRGVHADRPQRPMLFAEQPLPRTNVSVALPFQQKARDDQLRAVEGDEDALLRRRCEVAGP